jgi:hypothetical protein
LFRAGKPGQKGFEQVYLRYFFVPLSLVMMCRVICRVHQYYILIIVKLLQETKVSSGFDLKLAATTVFTTWRRALA